jgi:hypothetical protein
MAEFPVTPVNDLGLTIEDAKVGLRVATAYVLKLEPDRENGPIIPLEQLRMEALYTLLISKGVITEAEYDEAARLIYNSELARREEALGQEFR